MNDVVKRLLQNNGQLNEEEIDNRDLNTVLDVFINSQERISGIVEDSRLSFAKELQ